MQAVEEIVDQAVEEIVDQMIQGGSGGSIEEFKKKIGKMSTESLEKLWKRLKELEDQICKNIRSPQNICRDGGNCKKAKEERKKLLEKLGFLRRLMEIVEERLRFRKITVNFVH